MHHTYIQTYNNTQAHNQKIAETESRFEPKLKFFCSKISQLGDLLGRKLWECLGRCGSKLPQPPEIERSGDKSHISLPFYAIWITFFAKDKAPNAARQVL